MRPPLAEDISSDAAEAKRTALRSDVDLMIRGELPEVQAAALRELAEHDEDLASYIDQMRALYRRHELLLNSGLL
jgi:hypothetical protein